MDWHADWITGIGAIIAVYWVLDALHVIKSKLTKIEQQLARLNGRDTNGNCNL